MNNKVTCVILSSVVYKEKDIMLRVLSSNNTLLTFVVRGANSIKSKRKSATNPFTIVEAIIDYQEDKTMYTIKDITVLKSNKKILMNPLLISLCNVISEIALKSFFDYDYLNKLIMNLDESNGNIILALFISAVLKENGIEPYVDGCVICNDTKIVNLSYSDGGLVCKEHNKTALLEIELLYNVRACIKANIDHLKIIEDNLSFNISLLNELINYLEFHLGYVVKSYKMYKILIN